MVPQSTHSVAGFALREMHGLVSKACTGKIVEKILLMTGYKQKNLCIIWKLI